MKHGKKVFTASGSEYPSDESPFTYRKVFKNNNTYFVIAEKGDTYEKIAQDILVMSDNLRKFNDAGANEEPVENEIVYVEAKARGNAMRVHTVQAGETLRYISQRYGVQLRYIFKYNMLDENSVIHPGDQILLRRYIQNDEKNIHFVGRIMPDVRRFRAIHDGGSHLRLD